MKRQFFLLLLVLSAPMAATAQRVIDVTPANFTASMKELKRAARSMKQDVVARFHGGEYRLEQPLVFDINSSGRSGHMIRLEAAQGEQPVLSGGVRVKGWTRVHGNLWQAPLKSNAKLRSLFVNGRRCRMAGSRNLISGLGAYGEYRIQGNEPWAFGAGTAARGLKMQSGKEMAAFRNPEDVELVQNVIWNEKILCVKDMQKWGDTIAVELQQPYGAILTNLKWAKMKWDGQFFVRNAMELLDDPGEFYFDRSQQTLYYMADGEDMEQADVIAPLTEGLIRIIGQSTAKRAGNIAISGLTFAYDAWNLMGVAGSRGFGGIQTLGLATKYLPDGNWHPTKYNSCDVPEGTIEIRSASNVRLERNRFLHLSSAVALNMDNDASDIAVTGNVFVDLLGCAVSVGHPQHYEIGDGEGRFAKGIEGVCRQIRIDNNYVRNVSIDFRQLEAMNGFFVRNVSFLHNDIAGTPYGAIALGWWWGNAQIPESKTAGMNTISFNKLGNTHHVLTDGGIIYMLGRQPGSVCADNYLYNGPRCIYPDDGSSGWTIRHNFINSLRQMWLHIDSDRDYEITVDDNHVKDNYLKNSGLGVEVTRTHVYRNVPFAPEALAIEQTAGLEPAFRDIVPQQEPEPTTIYIEMSPKKIQ